MLGTHAHEETHKSAGSGTRTRTMRELLNIVCLQYPHANNDRIAIELQTACEDEGQEAQHEVYLYCVTKLKPIQRPAKTAEQRAAEEARVQASAERSQREWLKNMMRLDFKMPNGKLLGDCTGSEIGMIGGIFLMIASRVGDRLTKDVLSNEDLQAMVPDLAH